MKDSTFNILIAGGGTGGHLFPAIAVAEEFISACPYAQVVFVGTSKGLEARVIPLTMWELILMDVPSLKGAGIGRKLKTLLSMPKAFVQALKILKNTKPRIVIGVGGYAAGPLTLMSALKGIPTVIMEQNAIAGVTNRILGRFVDKVFVTFEESASFFSKKKVIVSGNPVRKKIRDAASHRPLKRDGFHLLVFGGSQGAHSINESLIEALGYLTDIKEDLHIVHQVGRAEDIERFAAAYRARGFSAEAYHFIEDMGKAYLTSDAAICRAGATSIAELTVMGRPAILVPYPHAAGNHQAANAGVLASNGAAIVIKDSELTGEILAREIKKLIEEPLVMASMAEAMKNLGRPDAAKVIVNESMRLLK